MLIISQFFANSAMYIVHTFQQCIYIVCYLKGICACGLSRCSCPKMAIVHFVILSGNMLVRLSAARINVVSPQHFVIMVGAPHCTARPYYVKQDIYLVISRRTKSFVTFHLALLSYKHTCFVLPFVLTCMCLNLW